VGDGEVLGEQIAHGASRAGACAICRKQGNLRRSPLVLVEHLDRLAPSRLLRIVDLPEVEHLALHHTPVGDATVLDDAPATVLLAVLETIFRAQEHADSIGENPQPSNGPGRHYTRFRKPAVNQISALARANGLDFAEIQAE
jgi:hypothetical protein